MSTPGTTTADARTGAATCDHHAPTARSPTCRPSGSCADPCWPACSTSTNQPHRRPAQPVRQSSGTPHAGSTTENAWQPQPNHHAVYSSRPFPLSVTKHGWSTWPASPTWESTPSAWTDAPTSPTPAATYTTTTTPSPSTASNQPSPTRTQRNNVG